MESLAYSALLTPLPPIHNDTLIWKNQLSRMALLGSAASLVLLSSTLPAGAIVVQGSNCDAVKDIQQALTEKNYDVGGVDGVFGPKTYAAVVKFQTDQKLAADGIVGVKTAEALGLKGAVYAAGATCEAEATPEPAKAAATPSQTSSARQTSSPSQTSTSNSQQKYKVVAEVLNVRGGPGTTHNVVDVLFKDEEVQAIGSEEGWLQIGEDQWISSRFVTELSSGTATSTANAEKPSSPTTVSTVSQEDSAESADQANTDGIEIITTKELDPSLSTGYIRVMAEALNVRAEPNTEGEVVGYVAKDEVLPLTGKATKNGWIQLAWGDWVSAAFVEPVVVEENN